jgi:hypothetical protein
MNVSRREKNITVHLFRCKTWAIVDSWRRLVKYYFQYVHLVFMCLTRDRRTFLVHTKTNEVHTRVLIRRLILSQFNSRQPLNNASISAGKVDVLAYWLMFCLVLVTSYWCYPTSFSACLRSLRNSYAGRRVDSQSSSIVTIEHFDCQRISVLNQIEKN